MLHLIAQAASAAAPEPTSVRDFGYCCGLSSLFGVIEGVTEFLPISSTAHLRIAEAISNIDLKSEYWRNVFRRHPTRAPILSIPILFRDRIVDLVKNFPRGESGKKTKFNHPLSLVIIGFLVTAGPCYLADKKIASNLDNLLIMAVALILGGFVMWAVDALCTKPKIKRMEDMSIWNAVWIGAVQVLSAAFPGTSRSMCTIAAGQVAGMSRSSALEYSFFLSMPTMLAATCYKFLEAIIHRPKTDEEIRLYGAPDGQWIVLAIGFVISFIVALGVNGWFISWVRRRGFVGFAIYRILLGAALLVWVFMMGA